jgi:pimeloyl-ACP methyl ester carboxylesterase
MGHDNETFHVGGATLDGRRLGSGEPLLVLHGEDGLLFCGSFLEELARSFELIVPLHPGWGAAPRPEHVTAVPDIAELYHELVESLGRPVTVVGLSIGGWIAAQMAATCSHGLSRLVLVAPIGIKLGDRETRDFEDIWMLEPAQARAVLYGDPAAAPRLDLLDDAGFLALATAQEAVARYAWEPYMHDPKLVHRLRRIALPTLVVSGDRDSFVLDPGYFAEYAARIGPAARHVVLPGAGHRVEEEAPGELARLISEFAKGAAGVP